MILSVGFTFSAVFFIVFIGAYYFFLKDDYAKLKKYQSYEGLKSEELVELISKLQRNKYMTILEMVGVVFSIVVFMGLLIDVLNIKMPSFLSFTLLPLYLISLEIYVLKRRIHQSIEIFKSAKRTG